MDNTAGHPRMGLIVPKFQSTAVARNRLRRRLQEIWRREIQDPTGRAGSADPGAQGGLRRATFANSGPSCCAWVEGL